MFSRGRDLSHSQVYVQLSNFIDCLLNSGRKIEKLLDDVSIDEAFARDNRTSHFETMIRNRAQV